MNIYDNLKKIIKKINITHINLDQINLNIKMLIQLHSQLKTIWDSLEINNNYEILENNSQEYNKIWSEISDSFLNNYDKLNKNLNSITNILKFSNSNINFYYLYKNQFDIKKDIEKDIELIKYMVKISICLNKYKIQNDNIIRNIIWLPINSNRDFTHDKITNSNLHSSSKNFEAFVASGLTYGTNPRVTIVTRYEEVVKLLIHELIHNYNLDGSLYHDQLIHIINKYKKIKQFNNSITKNYDYEYSIYESYTELLSTYINLIFTNIEIKNIKLLEEKFKAQIILELVYSYNTIANIAYLNGYNNWDDFVKRQSFKGDICVYEYYYIKGLMYNNYTIVLGNNLEEFKQIYKNILDMIIKLNITNDKLLIYIFTIYQKQNNFKYIIN